MSTGAGLPPHWGPIERIDAKFEGILRHNMMVRGGVVLDEVLGILQSSKRKRSF